jgi:hypothetical protein
MISNNKIDNLVFQKQDYQNDIKKMGFLFNTPSTPIAVKKIPVRIVIEDETVSSQLRTNNYIEESHESEILSKVRKEAPFDQLAYIQQFPDIFWMQNQIYNYLRCEYSKYINQGIFTFQLIFFRFVFLIKFIYFS